MLTGEITAERSHLAAHIRSDFKLTNMATIMSSLGGSAAITGVATTVSAVSGQLSRNFNLSATPMTTPLLMEVPHKLAFGVDVVLALQRQGDGKVGSFVEQRRAIFAADTSRGRP